MFLRLSKPVINFTFIMFSLVFSSYRIYCQDSFLFYLGCLFFLKIEYTYNLIVKNQCGYIATTILKMSLERAKTFNRIKTH